MYTEIYGEQHPAVADTLQSMASTRQQQGNYPGKLYIYIFKYLYTFFATLFLLILYKW